MEKTPTPILRKSSINSKNSKNNNIIEELNLSKKPI